MRFYLILGLLFALLVAVFAVQNATLVDIRFLGWEFKNISLALVVLGAAAGGALMVFILSLGREVRHAWRMRELSSHNLRLSQRLSQVETEREKSHASTREG
ncbi:MAG: LapA family protein [Bacillota bacterium]|nr:LapA family protein [Thermoanaerobacteraceae bacterium]